MRGLRGTTVLVTGADSGIGRGARNGALQHPGQCRLPRAYRDPAAGGAHRQALSLYYDTAESREGMRAFLEKRKPQFRKYAK